ncbi:hypothetical protein KIL84_015309 [Mauremys mutica]|uniref:Uncharacterized protein n=1 Tax=Mauremys mutica TaxID=74926 RepID=A0A9D4AM24_9SAUR|nr:hypothetical protein KIL84_015309 [Mauremys mutica]
MPCPVLTVDCHSELVKWCGVPAAARCLLVIHAADFHTHYTVQMTMSKDNGELLEGVKRPAGFSCKKESHKEVYLYFKNKTKINILHKVILRPSEKHSSKIGLTHQAIISESPKENRCSQDLRQT